MTTLTPDTLAHYLEEMESGRMTIQECLAAHPAQAAEIRQLLAVVFSIPAAPSVTPATEFRQQARRELLQAISQQSNSVTSSGLARLKEQLGQLFPVRRIASMPALIIALALALASAGGGTAYASQDALPGDALYQVKTTMEGIQVAMAASDEGKAQVHLDLAAKRLGEAEKAAQKGRPDALQASAASATQQMEDAKRQIDAASASGRDLKEVSAKLQANLERLQGTLASVIDKAPAQAKRGLTNAAEHATTGLQNAISQLDPQGDKSVRPSDLPAGKPEGAGVPTDTPTGKPEGVGPANVPAGKPDGVGRPSPEGQGTAQGQQPAQAGQSGPPVQTTRPSQAASPNQPAEQTHPTPPAAPGPR